MYTSDFIRTLQRLNSYLMVKNESIIWSGLEEYPIVGLYNGQKFLMAIPRVYVPEYSIAGVNLKTLERWEPEKYKEVMKTGHCDKERIVLRGWKAILTSLVRQGCVDKDKTEKLFYRFHYEQNRSEYPRTYVQMDV